MAFGIRASLLPMLGLFLLSANLVKAQADPDACAFAPCPPGYTEVGSFATVFMRVFSGPDETGTCAYAGGGFIGQCQYDPFTSALVGSPGDGNNRFSCPLQGIQRPSDCDQTTTTTSDEPSTIRNPSTSERPTTSPITSQPSSTSIATSSNPSITSEPVSTTMPSTSSVTSSEPPTSTTSRERCLDQFKDSDKYCADLSTKADVSGLICPITQWPDIAAFLTQQVLIAATAALGQSAPGEQRIAVLNSLLFVAVPLALGIAASSGFIAPAVILAFFAQRFALLCGISLAINILASSCNAGNIVGKAITCPRSKRRGLLELPAGPGFYTSNFGSFSLLNMTSTKRDTLVVNPCQELLKLLPSEEQCASLEGEVTCDAVTESKLLGLGFPAPTAKTLSDTCPTLESLEPTLEKLCILRKGVADAVPFCTNPNSFPQTGTNGTSTNGTNSGAVSTCSVKGCNAGGYSGSVVGNGNGGNSGLGPNSATYKGGPQLLPNTVATVQFTNCPDTATDEGAYGSSTKTGAIVEPLSGGSGGKVPSSATREGKYGFSTKTEAIVEVTGSNSPDTATGKNQPSPSTNPGSMVEFTGASSDVYIPGFMLLVMLLFPIFFI